MDFLIRSATSADAESLGAFGAALARQHHGFDKARFMLPRNVEEGYRAWLVRESRSAEAVVIVAERGGQVVGYAYGRLEERDWNALLDACGGFHDVWVDPSARGAGLGAALVEEMVRRLKALGAPRVVLKA